MCEHSDWCGGGVSIRSVTDAVSQNLSQNTTVRAQGDRVHCALCALLSVQALVPRDATALALRGLACVDGGPQAKMSPQGREEAALPLHMIQSQSLPAIAATAPAMMLQVGLESRRRLWDHRMVRSTSTIFLTVVGPANLSRQRQSTMKALFMKHRASSEKQALLTFDQFHAMMTEMSPVELVMNNLWIAARSARHASPSVDISRARKQAAARARGKWQEEGDQMITCSSKRFGKDCAAGEECRYGEDFSAAE